MSQAELVAEMPATTADFLPLKGIEHIELYVGNAKQSAYFYRAAFGFSITGYAGLETGSRDKSSYLLEQGKVRLILSTPLPINHQRNHFLAQHGDGVGAITMPVD